MRFCNGPVFQEETAAVEIKCDSRRQVVFVLAASFKNSLILFVNPFIETVKSFNCRLNVDILNAKMPQPTVSGSDIQSNIIIFTPTRKPRPCPVAKLHLSQLSLCPDKFRIKAVLIKQDTNISAPLAFLLALS